MSAEIVRLAAARVKRERKRQAEEAERRRIEQRDTLNRDLAVIRAIWRPVEPPFPPRGAA